MAFSVTARQTGNSGQSAAQTLTTSSDTPTADSLFLVCWGAQANNQDDDFSYQSPSGGGLTYTQVVEVGETVSIPWDGSDNFRICGVMHRADIGGSPSAFQVVLDAYAGGANAFYAAICLDVTGHDAADPIAQSASNGADGGAGDSVTGTVTLGSTPASGSLVVVALGAGADDAGGFAAPTMGGQSMTEVVNQDSSFTQAAVYYRVVDGTESDNTITCTDMGQTVGNWTMIAVEVNVESGGAITEPVALVTETDAAQPVTSAKTKALSLASETDTAQSISAAKAKQIGQPSETDTAQPVTAAKAYALGQAGSTETAQPITALKTYTIGQATESDTALGVTAADATPVGLATETDQALPITALKTYTLGLAVETDTALALVTGEAPTPIVLPPYREPAVPDYMEAPAVPAYREPSVPAYQESAT